MLALSWGPATCLRLAHLSFVNFGQKSLQQWRYCSTHTHTGTYFLENWNKFKFYMTTVTSQQQLVVLYRNYFWQVACCSRVALDARKWNAQASVVLKCKRAYAYVCWYLYTSVCTYVHTYKYIHIFYVCICLFDYLLAPLRFCAEFDWN